MSVKPTMTQAMSVLTSHQTVDWYTPPFYIELVRSVLDGIDLDPATDVFPQRWIKANRYWTIGMQRWAHCPLTLDRQWQATTIFLNPPYGKGPDGSNQAAWSAKMCAEYKAGHFEQGILLVNSTHGYRWYEDLWTRFPVCCCRERIRFIKPDGTEGGQAKRGQTFVYFGPNIGRFGEIFSQIGRIVLSEK